MEKGDIEKRGEIEEEGEIEEGGEMDEEEAVIWEGEKRIAWRRRTYEFELNIKRLWAAL